MADEPKRQPQEKEECPEGERSSSPRGGCRAFELDLLHMDGDADQSPWFVHI